MSDDWLHDLVGSNASESGPVVRRPLAGAWPALATLYGVLIVAGVLANSCMLVALARRPRRADVDQVCAYIVNLAIANIVQCVVVLPASLAVLLLQKWIFGRALCYCMPMIQDIPLHVTTVTFFLLAMDRYRLVLYPCKPRVPAYICSLGAWAVAACIVVPYPFYITYIDLGLIREELAGTGLCIVNLLESMQDYMRGLFLLTYVLPLSAIAYLFVRVSQELKVQDGPLAVMMYEAHSRSQRDSVSLNFRDDHYGLYEAELDVNQEKRTDKYLVSMVTVYAICMCPLMVLRLVNQVVTETYENSIHYDITYILFVWFAFIHTCSTPVLFASWVMSPIAKERLRDRFRLSGRRLRRRSESAVEAIVHNQTSTPTCAPAPPS